MPPRQRSAPPTETITNWSVDPETAQAASTAAVGLLRIRTAGAQLDATSIDTFRLAIWEAKQTKAARTLGFRGWAQFLAAALQDSPPEKLPPSARQEVIGILAAEGMATRQIGSFLRISHETVAREIDYREAAGLADRAKKGAKKSVEKEPAPTATRQRPALTRSFFAASEELRKIVVRLGNLHDDNRFAANRNTISTIHRHGLENAAAVINEILRDLPEKEGNTK